MNVPRKAALGDARGVADVYLASRQQHVAFAPLARSEADVRTWIADKLIPSGGVYVIEKSGVVAGMIAMAVRQGESWIDHLYVMPALTGRGLGSSLIELAKQKLEAPIFAWTFQQNQGAARFYERHGFRRAKMTDGSSNEERCPDVLYRFERHPLNLQLRPALPTERMLLEELQWKASLNNTGDRASLLAHRDAIELPVGQIERGGVFVAEAGGAILGFAAIVSRQDGDADLDALFVDPTNWRRGIGRALVDHCCAAAKSAGSIWLHVLGNPHAGGFYESCGFVPMGTKPTRFGVALVMKRSVT